VAQQIEVDITTESGAQIKPFSFLTINQRFNGHHSFELRFNHDVLEKSNAVIIDKAKDFLGASITFTLKTKAASSYPDNIFKAIITEIGIANNIGSSGDLIFKGYSPSILLEGGKNNESFTQKNLNQIVKAAHGSIPGNLLNTVINPKFKSSIPYLVQYQETAFEFIRRLSGQYGEWFFYDGKNLNFGKPSNSPNIELKYPRDITDLNLNVKVVPLKFNQVDYFSKNNEKFLTNSESQQVSGLDKFGSHAMNASNKLFVDPALLFSDKKMIAKGDLDTLVKTEKSSRAADLVYLNASSDSPYVNVGTIIKVAATKQDTQTDEDFGKYLVMNATHSTDGLGNYSNSFTGIPAGIEVVPNPYDNAPEAEPQLGMVKQNDDPDNLGRIKVQLLWQDAQEMTPWLRVMSMHAGTRTGGDKNRGIFFTPEVGDYVIVGFTQNDPDRPFVMGSVPHGKAIDSSKNDDNHIKSIRTRSGSTIYFKDKENSQEQEIIVKTDDENLVSILVQNGKGLIKIKSSKDIEVTSDKTVHVKSEKITIEASESIEMKAKNISIEANQGLKAKGMTITMEANQDLKAKGTQVTIEGSATTTVKASAKMELSGGGMMDIKAGLIKIN